MKVTQNLKILVVDDSVDIRDFIKHILRKKGFKNISSAKDGAEAFNLMRTAADEYGPIELVLSDWQMPNVDGYELFVKTRTDQMLKETVFIMVTADNNEDHVMQAIGHGIDNYVIKPLNADILLKKITQSLKNHH